MAFGGILEGAKRVWHFITSGVRSGVESAAVTTALEPVQDIFDISTVDETYGLYDEAIDNWQKIHNIPDFHTISEDFSLSSPFDWKQDHIMQMRIQGIDLNTGEQVDTWITVENDRAVSKDEWLGMAQEAVEDSPFGYSYSVDYVAEWEYYTKGR